jgi:hypothetical protein
MGYIEWFRRREDYDATLRCYVVQPESVVKQDQLRRYDNYAAEKIAEAEALIASLKEYRAALAERYNYYELAAYSFRLELLREVQYQGKKCYWVRIVKVFENGKELVELSERYEGRERSKAFQRFKALQKERPGIEVYQDTEKRSWER